MTAHNSSPPIDAEVIPPEKNLHRFIPGLIHRPGFTMFTVGVLTGLILGGVSIYLIKKKL